jgi:hypothetical protein
MLETSYGLEVEKGLGVVANPVKLNLLFKCAVNESY